MKENKPNLIPLGTAIRSHGLKGSAIVKLYNEDPLQSLIKRGIKVQLKPKKAGADFIETEVQQVRWGAKVILTFEGFDSIDKIQALLPFEISVCRSDFPAIEEGKYYLVDLLGMEVLEVESHKYRGHISDLYQNGANQDVCIVSKKGDKSWEFILDSPLVAKIDWDQKKIYVREMITLD